MTDLSLARFGPDGPLGCGCQYALFDGPDDPYEGPHHFARTCGEATEGEGCGRVWYSTHCVHDGFQRECPTCGRRATQLPEPEPLDDPLA